MKKSGRLNRLPPPHYAGRGRIMVEESVRTEIQVVVFDLASEYYGVEIGDVREILRMQEITRVPGAPTFVEGVINLRGRVVPVVDLRKRLLVSTSERTQDTRILVVDMGGRDVGVIVDAVTEVLRIEASLIEPASSMITSAAAYYLKGIAKLETKLVILLNLDRVLSAVEKDGLLSMEETEEELSANRKNTEAGGEASGKKKAASVQGSAD